MPNLNIAIDAELLREVNVKAAKTGLTQREWVIAALGKAVGTSSAVGGTVEPKKVKKAAESAVSAKVEVSGPAHPDIYVESAAQTGRKCRLHGKAMLDFGTKWACEGPPFHTELK